MRVTLKTVWGVIQETWESFITEWQLTHNKALNELIHNGFIVAKNVRKHKAVADEYFAASVTVSSSS
jgi:hypothetical protein